LPPKTLKTLKRARDSRRANPAASPFGARRRAPRIASRFSAFGVFGGYIVGAFGGDFAKRA